MVEEEKETLGRGDSMCRWKWGEMGPLDTGENFSAANTYDVCEGEYKQ